MKKITFFIALFMANLSFAQLAKGDLAIVGYVSDNPDLISLVALSDISGGEVVKFTDNGWESSGSFRSNEGIITWTSPTEGVSAGTVFTIANEGSSIGSLTGTMALAGTGDQVLVYQELNDEISFIYAMNNEGSAVWQINATDSNTSALPTGLLNEENAIALSEIDNAYYSGTVFSGTKDELLAEISNKDNWTGDNTRTNDVIYSGGDFTVNSDPTLTNQLSDIVVQIKVSSSNGVVTTNRGEIVAVYNTLGQKVANANLQGVYIVRVQDGAQVKAVKVLVK